MSLYVYRQAVNTKLVCFLRFIFTVGISLSLISAVVIISEFDFARVQSGLSVMGICPTG